MKKNKNAGPEIGFETESYSLPVGIYIAVCLAGLFVIIVIFNGLIEQHDRQLTKQVCNLVTEKVTSSIEYMTKSTEDISIIMSYGNYEDFGDVYKQLHVSTNDADYLSIGIILSDGTIYASESEKKDLIKWGLVETGLSAEGVEISKPYRSGLTGQLVFTMFSGIDIESGRIGCLYVTYPLDELLTITYSKSLDKNTEVWLMDKYSDNIIRCSGREDFLIGSWSNMKLNKEITETKEYTQWIKLMHDGAETGSVTYKEENGDTYTQVFEKIGCMDGWNIVVRIPNKELSSTMSVFRWAIVIFALVVVTATVILLTVFKKHSNAEKKILENLSIYDPLSQVMNRRAFDFSAKQYFESSLKTAGALMFLDIDYFKQINDKYGHDAGDKIIVSVAASLKDMFGGCGVVSRYGGDEFVVLIKNKSKNEVHRMVEKLRENMRGVKITDAKVNADDFELHFSAGLAEFPKNGTEFKELIKCADNALYVVKEHGRNGFGWFEEQ